MIDLSNNKKVRPTVDYEDHFTVLHSNICVYYFHGNGKRVVLLSTSY